MPTLVGVRPCLAGSEQIRGNDPQGKGRVVAVWPWGGLTSTQGREAGFGYQPAKRDIAQQRALAFSGAWSGASNHHPDNGTSLIVRPPPPAPKPAAKTICPLKFPCDGVAEPHAVLEEGLESICHQSQPLILSGYYCIIEPGIEGQALIATMVIRAPPLNSKKGHGFACFPCTEAAIACHRILEDKNIFISAPN